MNLYRCAKFDPDRSSGLEAFPDLRIDETLTQPCPSGTNGLFFFSSCALADEYAYMCQMWSRSVQLFGIFPIFFYLRPPNPLLIPLRAREVTFFSRCPFPDKTAYVCQIWPRSVQWFATGPSVTANVSSGFSRCCADSRKNTPKNNIYTSKIIIPARTC